MTLRRDSTDARGPRPPRRSQQRIDALINSPAVSGRAQARRAAAVRRAYKCRRVEPTFSPSRARRAAHFAVEPAGISAKSLAVILGETLSGAPIEEVAEVPGDIVYRLFGRELSMGKSMGLMGMISMVTKLAKKSLTP
jgi:hypothetical protein